MWQSVMEVSVLEVHGYQSIGNQDLVIRREFDLTNDCVFGVMRIYSLPFEHARSVGGTEDCVE